jgi:hypothetical protein
MRGQISFISMFCDIAQMAVARFALSADTPVEYKDSMDTWQCWEIDGWSHLRLVITLPNPDLPVRDQFGCIGIVDKDFKEEFAKTVSQTTLQLMESLFLFRVITTGDANFAKIGRDIIVDCPGRDYNQIRFGRVLPLEVISGIMGMLAALRQTDHTLLSEECTCPKACDCENPPPDDWDGKNGTYHISNSCPIHNENPEPDPDCPVHGHCG